MYVCVCKSEVSVQLQIIIEPLYLSVFYVNIRISDAKRGFAKCCRGKVVYPVGGAIWLDPFVIMS